MATNPAGFNQKNGAMVPCARCGKEIYKSGYFLKANTEFFCCIAHAQEHRKKTRQKVSNCTVCEKEMTGDDLRQFWGKCGRDKHGKIHGMCRACKKKSDEARRAKRERGELERRERIEAKKKPCQRCGEIGILNHLTGWCKTCRDVLSEEHKALYHQMIHRRVMETPTLHLNMVMRASINQCLHGRKNRRKTFDLVGYSVGELKAHLERQFKPGMSWENHGPAWHIDHIIPLSAFNFSCPEDPDFRRAWALSNLRPLWARENLSKNDRLDGPFQPCLQTGV